jgi:DUF4097 and DUF4098 domain-containing protein YvlB
MTNNKQQTAVEQFLNAIKDQILLSKEHLEMIESYADQCKEIEKEQQEKLSASWAKSREQTRETAMHIGFAKGFMSGLECHEDYYEELNTTQLDEEEFTRNYITDRFEENQGGTNESN